MLDAFEHARKHWMARCRAEIPAQSHAAVRELECQKLVGCKAPKHRLRVQRCPACSLHHRCAPELACSETLRAGLAEQTVADALRDLELSRAREQCVDRRIERSANVRLQPGLLVHTDL